MKIIGRGNGKVEKIDFCAINNPKKQKIEGKASQMISLIFKTMPASHKLHGMG